MADVWDYNIQISIDMHMNASYRSTYPDQSKLPILGLHAAVLNKYNLSGITSCSTS